ncbi:hypothetical protein M9458_039354, partial [Cirrhinus mrigala]
PGLSVAVSRLCHARLHGPHPELRRSEQLLFAYGSADWECCPQADVGPLGG